MPGGWSDAVGCRNASAEGHGGEVHTAATPDRRVCGPGVYPAGGFQVVGIMRLNVYVPDALVERVREDLPGINVSATLQAALSGLLECDHAVLSCDECTAALGRVELEGAGVRRFFDELAQAVEQVVWTGGTATGAAKALWDVGRAWRIPTASSPYPRPTRAERDATKETAWQRSA